MSTDLLAKIPVARASSWGLIDHVEIDPCGLVRISGWTTQQNLDGVRNRIFLAGRDLDLLQVYRVSRPDVTSTQKRAHLQAGVLCEYRIPPDFYNQSLIAPTLEIEEIGSFVVDGQVLFTEPHYGVLLDSPRVLHRGEIYSSGPPNAQPNPKLIELCGELSGRVLDFGCGSGGLVRHLRSQGVEAFGIEMNTEMIRNSIAPDVQPFITLYEGVFPSPYPSGSFDSIICSEVLEHIPEYEQAVTEFARLATKKVIVTVPDMAAIPICFRNNVVPWHLLEATHVNFFTQTSLQKLLVKHFPRVQFGRIFPCMVNDAAFYVSLVAFCEIGAA